MFKRMFSPSSNLHPNNYNRAIRTWLEIRIVGYFLVPHLRSYIRCSCEELHLSNVIRKYSRQMIRWYPLPSTITFDAQNITEINRPSLAFPHRDQTVHHAYLFKKKPAFAHFKLFFLSPACLSVFAHGGWVMGTAFHPFHNAPYNANRDKRQFQKNPL